VGAGKGGDETSVSELDAPASATTAERIAFLRDGVTGDRATRESSSSSSSSLDPVIGTTGR